MAFTGRSLRRCAWLVAGLFGRSITEVTAFRQSHGWMLYLLPVAGLVIVALYRLDPYKSDTNRVLEGIQSGTYVPLRMSPLIIISTVLTHAFGGSAGREGAALQLGGSLGGTIGKWLKLDEYDQKVMIMCGMSAAFSALFGDTADRDDLCDGGRKHRYHGIRGARTLCHRIADCA